MMTATATLDRRQFLGAIAGSLTLGIALNGAAPMGEAQASTPARVNGWLTIGADNSIVLTIGAADMGQGSFQGLGQILAEDLVVDPLRVATVLGAPTLASPAPIARSTRSARAVYAPTQVARSVLSLVVGLTGLPADKVSVRATKLGGGLGRKAEVDFVAQAVQVGMALQRPVQLMWPREEDFAHDQYGPMALVRARAGIDPSGYVQGWVYRNVSPSILGQRGSTLGAKGDSQGYEASNALPCIFGSRLVEWVSHPSPVPVGFWRSVGASINTFAVESMLDELAAAVGQDPYQYRRARLADPRWIAVLESAAALGNWSAPVAAGTARGIAIGAAFNSIVAAVVEVSGTSATAFKIRRVSVVIDSYLKVNPANVEAQLAGGVVHGINATLYGQQTFSNGAAQKRNFNVNRMIRLQEMPQVAVSIMPRPAVADRTVPIGGVGELGVPTLAPALANAVARLPGGTRVRTLPFFPNATMGGL